MIDPPQIVQTDQRRTAIIHITVPRAQIQEAMGSGIQELLDTLASQDLEPAGSLYSRHLTMDPKLFDFEIGVPVDAAVEPAGRVLPGELPAARVARTVYHGPYDGLAEAWGAFDAWLKSEGLTPGPTLWEVYAAGPESSPDPAEWRTELNRPLAG